MRKRKRVKTKKKKIRVYQITKELKLPFDDVLKHLKEMGITVKTPQNSVEESVYEELKKKLGFKTTEEEKQTVRRFVLRKGKKQVSEKAEVPGEKKEVPEQEEQKVELSEETKQEEKIEEKREEVTEEIEKEPSEIGADETFEKEKMQVPEEVEKEKEIAEEERVASKRPEEVFEERISPERKKRRKRKERAIPPDEKVESESRKYSLKKEIFKIEDLYTEEERAKFQLRRKIPPKRPVQKPVIKEIKEEKRVIRFEQSIGVAELAMRMGVKIREIIGKLNDLGIKADKFTQLDYDTAALIASEYRFTIEREIFDPDKYLKTGEDSPEDLVTRPPVVTVMGHVDHGKTTLLDALRKTNVAQKEAGGITQKIGASVVKTEKGTITFIDTPGHEAFTTMRARGANVTDIVVLIVAADDGVMPQTEEAINHAKAAGVPIIVAINKIDKPNAKPENVKTQLSNLGLIPEEWGGDTIFVNISALKNIGLNELFDSILVLSEVLELKANPQKRGMGVIIEARLEKGRGPVASIVVREGNFKRGDWVVCETSYGRIRAMLNQEGKNVSKAGPSTPVEIMGLNDIPPVGQTLYAVEDESIAKKIAEHYSAMKTEVKGEVIKPDEVTLESLFQRIGGDKENALNIILKADEVGTLEAVSGSLEKLDVGEVKINIIHKAVGAVTENDIMLASASKGIVIGFNVKIEPGAKQVSKREKIQVRLYDVIYKLIEDIELACKGMLKPEVEEIEIGNVEVRKIFEIDGVGKVLGCYVTDGKVVRNAIAKIKRGDEVIHEGKITSLKRFKNDVKEVQKGYECGLVIEDLLEVMEGDNIRVFQIQEAKN